MSNSARSIEVLIKELPPDIKKETLDFIEFLLQKRKRKKRSKLRQNWAGGLKEYRKKYTSLELQKKAQQWRSE